MNLRQTWTLMGALLLGALAQGCETKAYCFADCNGDDGSDTGPHSENTGGGVITPDGGASSVGGEGGAGNVPTCSFTNNGVEICDGVDNNCNGDVDDIEDLDLEAPETCGTCSNNCYSLQSNCMASAVGCTPSANPGVEPGTCTCTECADDYYDINSDGICEYYCVKTADDDTSCNNRDDNCNKLTDEDVNVCTSVTDCGKCGRNCVVLHGTPECVNNGTTPCDETNTQCKVAACDCTPGDCWWNLDNSAANGCEYQCELTNGGVEICGDAIDNDCDGKIDASDDDLSGDVQLGVACFGDPDGECATVAHAGLTECQGTSVVCAGASVLTENDEFELCDGLDNDCDGLVDDNAVDVGAPCGVSNIFPCAFGTEQCLNGVPVCVGAVAPQTEVCNGVDDDCDGGIDLTGTAAPSDSVGSCDEPIAPPSGATSGCQAGTKACIGGVIVCDGSVTSTSTTDDCNVDSNCDGVLSGQPNLLTDVNHCGSCTNDCEATAVHAIWTCSTGSCSFLGCEAGYYDLNNDNKCEYSCIFNQAQEVCNGIDDDCDGQIDEGLTAPSPVSVCGVSPSATRAECTTGVTVACVAGAWKCTFPTGVCSPSCSSATEVCDSYDNDCDGALNENVANYGRSCASDDGLPAPGHGACRTTGNYVCDGTSAVACNAVPASCSTLAGGCTEECDGVDNDCDGSVDEPFSDKGSNTTYYVKPVVTKISSSRWIYSYEASRPNATSTSAGTGNGYQTSAPSGETLDSTPSCSVANRIPWFNVTPDEAEQTCSAMGGFVCNTTDYQTACKPSSSCLWGYNPRSGSSSCATTNTSTKYCNLGSTYDFDSSTSGDQDGLLPTASSSIQNCYADWSGLQSNTSSTNKIYDLTGNLREITKQATNQYSLMGGAFNTQSADGAKCDFTFYKVDEEFKFYDTGFRCCFSSNPSP